MFVYKLSLNLVLLLQFVVNGQQGKSFRLASWKITLLGGLYLFRKLY